MPNQFRAQLSGRPVFIADYRSGNTTVPAAETSTPFAETGQIPERGIRYDFPAAGTERAGGHSDGYRFHITFAAGRLANTYALVLAFLREQGYENVPVPRDAAELRQFRLPPKLRHQLSLFGEHGYVHNPVKILFPVPAGNRGALLLELYNEHSPDHLLRFHRRK